MLKGTCHCGAISWTLNMVPTLATACNCTMCRRYGVLWAYGALGEDVELTGKAHAYRRSDLDGGIDFFFCPECGCVTHYIGVSSQSNQRLAAVNLRMAEPDQIAEIPIRHFDGLETWTTLPSDGRCVKDMWF